MLITQVEKNSIAEEMNLQPGDDLVSINGHAVRDILDYRFYILDDDLELEVRRNGETVIFEIEGGLDRDLGVDFEEIKCLSCGNHCIFCFVDQNPPDVRPTLRFKDEDFRMSFIYGSYVTLTNTSRRQLQRIVEQRLSPIYISVHAVDPSVRRHMLGIRADDRLLQKIEYLAEHRIEMHTQIVLCPGWNDGAVLRQTVEQLSRFFPAVSSVAVVPVGLTKHRQGLAELTPVSVDKAREVIDWGETAAQRFKEQFDSYFLYLADEFYLLADQPIPHAERYEGFAQVENGVGMVRRLLDDFADERRRLPAATAPIQFDIVTGRMAAPVLQAFILPVLNRIAGCRAVLRPVDNRFFGGGVTVSGLLSGHDIADQLAALPLGDVVVLPPNCLNDDGVFLDDWSVERLQNKLQKKVVQSQGGFLELFEKKD